MEKKRQRWSLLSLLALVFMPVIFLISWPISVIGTSVGRTRKGVLQTPVRYYQHTQTGRKVTLVGMIHIGKTAYYQRVQDLISRSAAEGYRILYEGVGKIDEKDVAELPEKQRIVVRQLQSMYAFMYFFSTQLADKDVVYQKHGLEYPEWWVRTDLELSHVSALFAEADLFPLDEPDTTLDRSVLKVLSEDVVGFIKTVLQTVIKLLPGMVALASVSRWFSAKKRARHHIIVTLRDEVAAEGILKYAEGEHVLSIWGSGHIPGIHKRLTAAGYQHTSTEWFDAFWT